MSEVCDISNKYWLPNKSATKLVLHKITNTPSSFQQKICSLHSASFWKHPLFNTCQLLLTVDEVCYILNKYWPPSNIPKHLYFYTREFISLDHLKKDWRSPSETFFRNILFLQHFHYFEKWVGFVIFQINADFLINHLTKYFCTRQLTPLLYFKKSFFHYPAWKLVKIW